MSLAARLIYIPPLAIAGHPRQRRDARSPRSSTGQGMSIGAKDFTELNDPDLITERRNVRERLERLPAHSANRTRLARLYERMTAEFDRRARAAWSNTQNGQA